MFINEWFFKKQLLNFIQKNDFSNIKGFLNVILKMNNQPESFLILSNIPEEEKKAIVSDFLKTGIALSEQSSDFLPHFKTWFLHAIKNDYVSIFQNFEDTYRFFNQHFSTIVEQLDVFYHRKFIAYTLERLLTEEYQKDKIINQVLSVTEKDIIEFQHHGYFMDCFPNLFTMKQSHLDRIHTILTDIENKLENDFYSTYFMDNIYASGLFIHKKFQPFMEKNNSLSKDKDFIEQNMLFLKGAFFHYLKDSISLSELSSVFSQVRDNINQKIPLSQENYNTLNSTIAYSFFNLNYYMHSGYEYINIEHHYSFYSENHKKLSDFMNIANLSNDILKKEFFYALINNRHDIYQSVEFLSLCVKESSNLDIQHSPPDSMSESIFLSVYTNPSLNEQSFRYFMKSHATFSDFLHSFYSNISEIFSEDITRLKKLTDIPQLKQQALWRYENHEFIYKVVLEEIDTCSQSESEEYYCNFLDCFISKLTYSGNALDNSLVYIMSELPFKKIIDNLCTNIYLNKAKVSSQFFERLEDNLHLKDYSNMAKEIRKILLANFKQHDFLNIPENVDSLKDIGIACEKYMISNQLSVVNKNKHISRL